MRMSRSGKSAGVRLCLEAWQEAMPWDCASTTHAVGPVRALTCWERGAGRRTLQLCLLWTLALGGPLQLGSAGNGRQTPSTGFCWDHWGLDIQEPRTQPPCPLPLLLRGPEGRLGQPRS